MSYMDTSVAISESVFKDSNIFEISVVSVTPVLCMRSMPLLEHQS